MCAGADVWIAAIGKPEMVKGDRGKPGATVVDVGVNRVDGRLVGDVDNRRRRASGRARSRRSPGGVGPMTIACLLRNTMLAAAGIAGS